MKETVNSKVVQANAQRTEKPPVESKQELIQFLLEGPEQKVVEKFTDESLEKEFQKIALIGGNIISLEIVKGLILTSAKIHKVTFSQAFYKEMFRLNNWKFDGGAIYRKPWLAAKYTNEIIYGRFSREILTALQLQNPYIIPGVRKFKHFQYLNADGQALLEKFIDETIQVMKESSDWYDFRVNLFNKYGVPYQLNLFK
jgi:hypothetical protein